MLKKVLFSMGIFVLVSGLGVGVAYAADSEALQGAAARLTQVFVTNWPSNQNVTVTNQSPIPVTVDGASASNMEYQVLFVDSNVSETSLVSQLNNMGSQGWRMVGNTVRATSNSTIWTYSYTFERPIQ